MKKKIAVVLFNLGGPDSLEAVEPFLRNLFSDPAILRVPGLVRRFLAPMIARRRATAAQEIYKSLGGSSPIVSETEAQAQALEAVLSRDGRDVRVLIAMRYWHPRAIQAVEEISKFSPDVAVLLPLYPQFSTTTTASSLAEFQNVLVAEDLPVKVRGPCCYPMQSGFVDAYADLLGQGLSEARELGRSRVLFSAHGLPESVIKAGDPYAWQVERTAEAIVSRLGDQIEEWRVTYQSRVGPLKWIGPATDAEVRECAREGIVPVVCPLAFVSEHSETLVELDIEYRHEALTHGAPGYVRIPAVGCHSAFIGGLADLVEEALAMDGSRPYTNARQCPAGLEACPHPIPENV